MATIQKVKAYSNGETVLVATLTGYNAYVAQETVRKFFTDMASTGTRAEKQVARRSLNALDTMICEAEQGLDNLTE